jgi:catechol 2,3-dioxygenase-like lactoylglutathione lyase family enzyme
MALNTISWLGYVALHCRDLQAARRFYRHVMGFPIAHERADWIQFQVGDTGLVLRPIAGGHGDRQAEQTTVQLGIRVGYDEISACYEKLKARGVELLEPPSDQGWGHCTLFFADPEGNLVEIYAELPMQHGV